MSERTDVKMEVKPIIWSGQLYPKAAPLPQPPERLPLRKYVPDWVRPASLWTKLLLLADVVRHHVGRELGLLSAAPGYVVSIASPGVITQATLEAGHPFVWSCTEDGDEVSRGVDGRNVLLYTRPGFICALPTSHFYARHCRLGTVWGKTAQGDAVRGDAGVEGMAADVAGLSDCSARSAQRRMPLC
jgi:hypothetical protein